jgi:hypothetical protein
MTSRKKLLFMVAVQGVATQLANAEEMANRLSRIYVSRGYAPTGTNPIMLTEAEEFGITPEQIAAFVVFADNLTRMYNNKSVTQGDYDTTLSVLRDDK